MILCLDLPIPLLGQHLAESMRDLRHVPSVTIDGHFHEQLLALNQVLVVGESYVAGRVDLFDVIRQARPRSRSAEEHLDAVRPDRLICLDHLGGTLEYRALDVLAGSDAHFAGLWILLT